MKISGFQKLSLIDFPGKVACVVFTQGCLFRCGYCHNPELIPSSASRYIPEAEILDYLEKNKRLLDGICITGGEPTLQKDLVDFIKSVKARGLDVKLDTNGIHPDTVALLLSENLLDYLAMDLKHTWDKYLEVIKLGDQRTIEKCQKTFSLMQSSEIDHEFRTTILPSVHTESNFFTMASYLKNGEKYFIQKTNFVKNLDKDISQEIRFDTTELVQALRQRFPSLIIDWR